MDSTCICCGRIIPEGRFICLACGEYDEQQKIKAKPKTNGDRIRSMTIEEARDYWSRRLKRAAGYSDEHWDADERREYADYMDALQHAITALAMRREYEEAKELKARGKWHPVRGVYGLTQYVCSLCGHDVPGGSDRNYCPNCGAEMKED